jgi:uncharacterized membrane protein YfcA
VTAGLSALVALPLHLVAYAAVVLFFAYLVRGIAGFGSGLIAVPLLSLTFPVTSVVPVVVALDYVGSFGQGARNLDRIAWKEQFALVPFMVIGIGLGLFALRTVPAGILGKVLGGFVVVYAIYQMLPLPPLRAAAWVAVVCGVLGGLVGTLFGGIRLVAYILLGLLSQHTLVVLLAALPVAAGALYLGGHIHTGVSQRAFVRLISVLLLGSGAALLLWR